jgi:hypothetical protein
MVGSEVGQLVWLQLLVVEVVQAETQVVMEGAGSAGSDPSDPACFELVWTAQL